MHYIGELLRATGPMAKANPLRFSTKYHDDETDLASYGFRWYKSSEGKFISRDPIEEGGGFDLYGMVNANPVNAVDPLGLTIQTHCDPIDDYLYSLGISFNRTGSYVYTLSGTDLGAGSASPKMIVSRMLFAGTVFTISSSGSSATGNLKRHVQARLTIVNNALKANFQFGPGNVSPSQWALFRTDPEGFFNSINNGGTRLECYQLTRIIFETGNDLAPQGVRRRSAPGPSNLVWIPGDWGYIVNKNFIPGVTDGMFAGENVIHTGSSGEGEMFWGHFESGVHPSESEAQWFDDVRHWVVPGNPEWRDRVKYTTIGLDRPTTSP